MRIFRNLVIYLIIVISLFYFCVKVSHKIKVDEQEIEKTINYDFTSHCLQVINITTINLDLNTETVESQTITRNCYWNKDTNITFIGDLYPPDTDYDKSIFLFFIVLLVFFTFILCIEGYVVFKKLYGSNNNSNLNEEKYNSINYIMVNKQKTEAEKKESFAANLEVQL